MTETPTDPVEQEPEEPSDEQLRSNEARQLRLQRNEECDARAAEKQRADAAEQRADAAERPLVREHMRAKITDVDYFMDKHDIASLRDESGPLDLDRADVAVTELIGLHPHLAAPGAPMVAPASSVGGSGLIGMPPRSVLDVENVAAAPATRDWSQFLSDATHAEYEGPL